MRLFLLWYQQIGAVHGRDVQLDDMFVTLLPDFHRHRLNGVGAVSEGEETSTIGNVSPQGKWIEMLLEWFVRDTLNVSMVV